ncbi:unnamed protein product [Onchocerca flexuosa]|uniref:Cold and drought-regulated protein CORA-like n=1 Tax=Onchocerca flexuosa TaxID=387005 RepID=A0A183HQK9_9BILA|nr:unnamed protein product [Onchocerca flexuosa]
MPNCIYIRNCRVRVSVALPRVRAHDRYRFGGGYGGGYYGGGGGGYGRYGGYGGSRYGDYGRYGGYGRDRDRRVLEESGEERWLNRNYSAIFP